MRMELNNYLSLSGNTINRLAHSLGHSRESVRRWRDTPGIDCVVTFEPSTGNIEKVEIGKTKTIKARKK